MHGYDAHAPYTTPLGLGELYDPGYRGVVHQPGFMRRHLLDGIEDLAYDMSELAAFQAGPDQAPGSSWRRRHLVPPLGPPSSLEASATAAEAQGPPTLPVRDGGLPPPLPKVWARLGPHDVAHIIAHYDGAVTFADTWLGLLREALQRRGLLDTTLLIGLGDHGEELGEHGRFGHGGAPHEALLHVPLVMSGPGLARGRRVREPVGLVDLAPTVLELCSIPPSHQHQGRPLGRLVRPGPMPPEDARRAVVSFANDAVSLRAGRWHLLRREVRPHSTGPSDSLYDVEADPSEQHDLSARESGELSRMKARLDDLLETMPTPPAPQDAKLEPTDQRALRHFGYW